MLKDPLFADCYINLAFYGKAHFPVDTRTKNMRTKGVHKKTFIFGSIWRNGKTSELEFLMKVPMRDVLRTSFSRPSFFFTLTHLEIS